MRAVTLPLTPVRSQVVSPVQGGRVQRTGPLERRFTRFRGLRSMPMLEMLDQVLGRGRRDQRNLFRWLFATPTLKMLDQIL